MDGLEKIKLRILSEARQEAQKITDEAENKASSIREEQIQKADKLKIKLENEANEHASDHKKRLIAAAQLDMRKDLLKTKREMLDVAFKGSISTIRNLPFSEYSEAIKEMIMSSGFQGEAEIVFAKPDKEKFDLRFIEEMNAVLKAIGKDMSIKFSDEIGGFEGGFVLKGRGVEINNSLETLTKLVRDEAEPVAAKILFAHDSNAEEGL